MASWNQVVATLLCHYHPLWVSLPSPGSSSSPPSSGVASALKWLPNLEPPPQLSNIPIAMDYSIFSSRAVLINFPQFSFQHTVSWWFSSCARCPSKFSCLLSTNCWETSSMQAISCWQISWAFPLKLDRNQEESASLWYQQQDWKIAFPWLWVFPSFSLHPKISLEFHLEVLRCLMTVLTLGHWSKISTIYWGINECNSLGFPDLCLVSPRRHST